MKQKTGNENKVKNHKTENGKRKKGEAPRHRKRETKKRWSLRTQKTGIEKRKRAPSLSDHGVIP